MQNLSVVLIEGAANLKQLSVMRLRANPDYEFVSVENLNETIRQQLDLSDQNQGLHGLLVPRGPGRLTPKALRQETSLLYQELQEPDYLSSKVQSVLGEHCNRMIATLVLEQIVEIEHDDRFVSGASAYELLWDKLPRYHSNSVITSLSMEALQMAQTLANEAPTRLISHLYHYNHMPVSPIWLRRLPTTAATAAYLGVGSNRKVDQLLARAWQSIQPPSQGWFTWRLLSGSERPAHSTNTYKIYVSPDNECLPEVFALIVTIFTEASVPVFKVGCDLHGLLRPDKLVAYFWNREEMMEVADLLATCLEGYPAHGVPFTAELAGNGMLSWGLDPPNDEITLGSGQESWRTWLARRMATYMLEANVGRVPQVEPWEYVMGRLQLEGIDTNTWTPTDALWS